MLTLTESGKDLEYRVGSAPSPTARPASQPEYDPLREGLELLREEVACDTVAPDEQARTR